MNKTTDLEITPCSPNDADILVSVAKRSYVQHYTYLWHDAGEAYLHRSFTLPIIQQEMADPNTAFFLAFYQTIPCGFLKLNLNKSLPECPNSDALEVERVYLLQEVSGKGIGRKLIEFAIQLAKDTRKDVVWLKTMDSSSAAGFYERMGFVPVGTEWLTYPEMKEEYRGMIRMQLIIGNQG